MTTAKRQCEFRRSNGKQCEARPRTNDRFCFFHSPETTHARRKARKAGGIARNKKACVLRGDTPEKQLRNTLDVCELLGETINQVRCGKLDPRVANSVGHLTNVLLRALEQGPMEERMARVEASLGLAANSQSNATQKEPDGDSNSPKTN